MPQISIGSRFASWFRHRFCAAGSVGAYAVQLARQARLHIVATAGTKDLDYVRGLGAEKVIDYRNEKFEELVSGVDIVLDTIGGATQEKSLRVLKPGGIIVSIVSAVPEAAAKQYGVRTAFFYAEVTTARLNMLTELIDSGKLSMDVVEVLPLERVRDAHEMLAGAKHKRGKIVLTIAH